MTTIDDKVVAMSFESSKFESGVNKTVSSLDKLKSSLKLDNAGKGLQDIDKAASRINLSHISRGVEEVKNRLNALRLTAVAVFAQIAARAIHTGATFVKALTLDPIKAGFKEYATNLNAVQTILANTQAAGTKLKDVNAALDELNEFSDKTIYNFSQMARNIGTFTAAGVDLKTATGAIKGIANLAALSGSNAQQASTAMYQLSQAISAGSVKLQDWNSVVNAGMGGTVFQRALAQTAEKVGTLEKGSVKLRGAMKNVTINGEAFRQSLSTPGKASWLTSDVLTKTLKQFTGDLSDAELAAQGFNAAEIKAIQQTAKTAMHAATEVKTIQQAFEVAKETAGSGWAETFRIVFGTFTEAKTTFTEFSETINGFINANADARNKVLADWKKMGGRTVLINSIKTAFHNLAEVVKPIKQAFRDIFPATTGKDLVKLTYQFKHFVALLKPSPETVENLRRTFRGLFALWHIGYQIVGGLFRVFRKLFGAVGEGRGGFLSFTASIGDFLVKVDQSLQKGGRLNKFFDSLGNILAVPIKLLEILAGGLTALFAAGTGATGTQSQIEQMTGAMEPLAKVVDKVATAWGKLMESFMGSGPDMTPVMDAIIQKFGELGPAISSALANMNFEAILQVIRTGLFAGLVVMFKNFLGRGSFVDQLGKGFAGGIGQNISGSFKALEGSMQSMQTNIKADTLKKIAIAIALLTASVVALSFVDPKRLGGALTAMTVAFGQLLGAMAILGNITKTVGFIKMPIMAASLIILAGAMLVLSASVVVLSRLSWNELLKGLAGVGVLLIGISLAAKPLSANSAGMIQAGVGITAMAIGLRIMADAVAAFAEMSMGELAKGLISISIGLRILVTAMTKMPIQGMIAAGAGLVLMSVGIRILANAVAAFGSMNWATIGKGMTALAGSLAIITVAMRAMPSNMLLTGAGLVLVAVALQGISRAIETMGGMSVGEMAKGLISLAISLDLLAGAMIAMTGTTAGATALTIAASGLAILAPALIALGKQSWTTIVKGLIALVGALVILGVAAKLLAPAAPALLALGLGLMAIGAAVALVGAGIFLLGLGLSALVVAAPTGVGVLLTAFQQLAEGLISNIKLMVLGLLEIVKAFAATAPQFVDALVKILNSLIDVIIKSTPKVVELFQTLLTAAIAVLDANQARIIQAGFNLLIALLQGIRRNIGNIARVVIEIITNLLKAIAGGASKIVGGGLQLLLALIRGIANNLGKITTAALSIITKFISAIASNVKKIIKAGTDIVVAWITGIGNAGPRIISAATDAIIKFINALGKNAVKLADAGAQAIIDFLNGMAVVIEKRTPEIRNAGFRIGVALVKGFVSGMGSLPGLVKDAAVNMAKSAFEGATGWLKNRSPSKRFHEVGQHVVQGFANGLSDHKQSTDAAIAMSNGVITAVEGTFQITSPSKVMISIGKQITKGLAIGLTTSQEGVKTALAKINNIMVTALKTARKSLADHQDKLVKLTKNKAGQAAKDAINRMIEVDKANIALLKATLTGRKKLNVALKNNKKDLLALAKAYDIVAERLTEAKGKLQEAKDELKTATDEFFKQYSARPDIELEDDKGKKVDPVTRFINNLRKQVGDTASYGDALKTLKGLGLDPKTLEKLIREGPTAANLAFATGLVAAGAPAVATINALAGQLDVIAQGISDWAGIELYQAGVDSGQKLVDGLTSSLDPKNPGVKQLLQQIKNLAKTMIANLKKGLGISSPSKEFAKIGVLSMEGLADGFSDSSKIVEDAVDQSGQDALTAMRRSMQNISNIVTNELDVNPTITPILDLTQVKSKAAELSALTSSLPTTATMLASSISKDQAVQEEQIAAAGGTSVKFEQNNYSPKALTPIEIYRQTRNQLSQVKSALALT